MHIDTPGTQPNTTILDNSKMPILSFPVELVFKIFFEVCQNNLKEASIYPRVCKKWQLEATESPLYQLFISQKYPQINVKSLGANSFSQAFLFANCMARMANAYSDANLNLLTYNTYKKQLVSLLEEHEKFLSITPYFDLRPFAWLDQTSWKNTFIKYAPLLKNVQVLNIEGICHSVEHKKVKLPHIPVVTEVTKVVKDAFKDITIHSQVNVESEERQKTKNFLFFCIFSMCNISATLTKLNCTKSLLTNDEIKLIKAKFPNIQISFRAT